MTIKEINEPTVRLPETQQEAGQVREMSRENGHQPQDRKAILLLHISQRNGKSKIPPPQGEETTERRMT